MSREDWGTPNYLVNSESFYKAVSRLEGRTQVTQLRRVLRNTSRAIYIPALKARAKAYTSASKGPRKPTGRLMRSMGNVAGKSRYTAVNFVGPRVPRGYRDASAEDRMAYTFHGGVANILEYWKDPSKRKTRFRIVMRSKSRAVQNAVSRGVEQLIYG